MSFERDVERITANMKAAGNDAVAQTIIAIFSGTVRDTPVDQGRLRGNWQLTLNLPTDNEIDREGAAGPVKDIIAKVNEPGLYYLTNNLPYAEVAEYGLWGTGDYATVRTTRDGFSIQAPYGMVRINARRVKRILARMARKAR